MKDLNEWTKNQIKEIEKMGNTVIGGKLCIKDSSGDNWFIPFSPFPEPEPPKAEIRRFCNEIITYIESFLFETKAHRNVKKDMVDAITQIRDRQEGV
ncbi:MAG: hypothetical protein KKB31_04650 [Nanoarchaeota archaeon]|nr:hypothetical protein [Nanoarchaeota archaeon]